MKAKRLKEMLERLPDNAEIVRPTFNYSYRSVEIYPGKARRDEETGGFKEYKGEKEDEAVVPVLVII